MNQPETEPARPGAVAFEVAPLGRRRGRRLDPGWIVAALIVALLLAAIAHPWQSSSPASAVVPSPGPPSRAPIPSLVAGDEPAASADSSSAPVQVVEQNQSSAPAPLADLAIDILDLAGNQGQWGVGVGASVGPPLQPALTIPALGVATDQAWWAWIGVRPSRVDAAAGGAADAIERLPVSDLCSDVPDLPTGAQVLVVTTPFGTPVGIQVQAWHEVGWHDEPRDIEPLPGVTGLIPRQTGGVTYLQLADGKTWPDGRYELDVDGPSGTHLTVCLGQP